MGKAYRCKPPTHTISKYNNTWTTKGEEVKHSFSGKNLKIGRHKFILDKTQAGLYI